MNLLSESPALGNVAIQERKGILDVLCRGYCSDSKNFSTYIICENFSTCSICDIYHILDYVMSHGHELAS